MSAHQFSFSLRVSSGVKTVHLLGSWDNYSGQLPLSKDKTSSKSGSWKGTFRFQNTTLEAGQRYWYYYIIDGYHVSHNPSEASVLEPTTGRELNILDVPRSHKSSSKSSSSSSSHKSSSRHSRDSTKSHKSSSSSRHMSVDIPKGRPLSVSQIKCPKPMSPTATRNIVEFDEDELSRNFAATGIYDDEYDTYSYSADGAYYAVAESPASSVGSSLSGRSSPSDSGSSLSGYSTPASDCSSCTCERYGITRKGERVRIDCGGSRCGYEDSCSSSDEDEDALSRGTRRHGIVVRH